jgi:hypothetical protein
VPAATGKKGDAVKVELELWQLVTIVFTLIGAFWAVAKLLLIQTKEQIDEKFKAISSHMKTQDESSRRLERELMELKAELPRDYVRREDYTQAIAIVMTKIDALGLRMENMFNQVIFKGGQRD